MSWEVHDEMGLVRRFQTYKLAKHFACNAPGMTVKKIKKPTRKEQFDKLLKELGHALC